MTKLKPFQKATAEAAIEAFKDRDYARRFLVADEVGLGKTVVAQQIIRQLMIGKNRPVVVFYVCSSLSIASQNKTKLLEILDDPAERRTAACTVDRLTLLPASNPPAHPKLHLYTLTPDTSIPVRQGRRRDGRQEERALIHALVESIWPDFLKDHGKNFFQRNAKRWWKDWVKYYRKQVRSNDRLREAFRKSVRTEFNLKSRQHFVPAVRDEKDAMKLIAHFRNALAASALDEIKPDLVIFDEFQRFRDLLNQDIDRAAARVIRKLRGEGTTGRPPGLLLLSATPYRLFTRRWEDAQGSDHHAEFFDLIEFLYGGDETAKQKRAECEAGLAELQQELRRGQPNSEQANEIRIRVETLLHPIIARTERAAYLVTHHLITGSHEGTHEGFYHLPAKLHPDDLKIYRHLSDSFADEHQASAVAYWTSIPLPIQTMGNPYITWQKATPKPVSDLPALTETDRDQFQALQQWPHPRLRTLMEELASPQHLALPWIAPSLPWWPLGGDWTSDGNGSGKLLIFSRFRAVPQAVASLLSYNLEATLMAAYQQQLTYADATRRRSLQATATRHNLLALFNPSPWLVTAAEPRRANSENLTEIEAYMQRQIKHALNELGISVRKPSKSKGVIYRRRTIWQLLGQIENQAGNWPWIKAAWEKLHQGTQRQKNPDAGLGKLLQQWDKAAQDPIDRITPQELKMLTEFALSAPGVVLGRALQRHWPEAVNKQGYPVTLALVWNGLRNYLDQRWFFMALKSEDEESYPEAIRRAVIEGNLEAVLDEHLWIISQLRSLSGSALAQELGSGLGIRSGTFNLHNANDKAETFSLRCHAALPFIQTQAQVKSSSIEDDRVKEHTLRADEIRKSFNSPFWPHVLVTTSVGQEGLDFHVWCNNLLHWDLCANPVDLEQREGRIQRFGGLAVRRAIAQKLGQDALSIRSGLSPWQRLSNLAEKELKDDSGLAPWWICDGAEIKRFVFDVPLSEQAQRLAWMQEQRLLYRIVLGQPNQEDLLEIIAKRVDGLQPEDISESILQLSPWFNRQHENGDS
jgi:hypothetical protein